MSLLHCNICSKLTVIVKCKLTVLTLDPQELSFSCFETLFFKNFLRISNRDFEGTISSNHACYISRKEKKRECRLEGQNADLALTPKKNFKVCQNLLPYAKWKNSNLRSQNVKTTRIKITLLLQESKRNEWTLKNTASKSEWPFQLPD